MEDEERKEEGILREGNIAAAHALLASTSISKYVCACVYLCVCAYIHVCSMWR